MKRSIENIVIRAGTIKEIFQFFWKEKLFWLIPLLIVLFVIGIFLVTAQSSAVAPFIYAIF